jgi:hypothetical protein
LTVNGSTVQNDSKLRTAAHCALNVWLVNDWQNPNWLFNEIGIPLQTTSQLLMLGDNATSFEIEKIKEISFRAAWWLNRWTDIGANLVWMIQVQLYRSLATNNLTGIEEGFTQIWKDIVPRLLNKDGIQLLSGVYRMVWAQNIYLLCVAEKLRMHQATNNYIHLFNL